MDNNNVVLIKLSNGQTVKAYKTAVMKFNGKIARCKYTVVENIDKQSMSRVNDELFNKQIYCISINNHANGYSISIAVHESERWFYDNLKEEKYKNKEYDLAVKKYENEKLNKNQNNISSLVNFFENKERENVNKNPLSKKNN